MRKEHSHLEIAGANRAKWLGQAERNFASRLPEHRTLDKISVHVHTRTHK